MPARTMRIRPGGYSRATDSDSFGEASSHAEKSCSRVSSTGMRSWLTVATSGLGVVVRNEYVLRSTTGPSFFSGPLKRHQMPGKAKSGRGSLPAIANQR
jgi:hypothetical protein